MKFRFICTGLLSFFVISLALSQCVPVTLECPDDITITADPGDCGAFYNYTVQTNGDCNLVSLTQTDASGLTSGDEFPFGTTTQSYSTLDDDGNTDQCTFFVTVLEFPNPITDDACNGNVNISPDDDCEVLVTADMILEGGPYGCYDNYIVSITTTAGVPVPNPITADYIGQTLMASVQDPSGNSCWGYINYEDYIITDLVCQTYTIACGSPTIPSTDTLTGIPFPIPAGYIITPSSGTGPFIVEDYDNCGDIQLSYVDDIEELDCAIGIPFTRIINRNWTAVDGQGNSTTCTDIIQVEVSDLSALNVFPDRNGTDAPSILCSGNWDANGDGIPQPDEIGDVLDMNCDVWGTYTDIIHPLQCGVLIDRDWQILNMCTGEHIDFIQQIKLEDDEPPVISCAPVLQGNAQNNCQATYTVPAPDLSDDCSEVTYTVTSSFGTPVNLGSAEYPQYVIYDVPLGTYSITYTAVDGCGNTAQCTSQLVVEDLTPPHINCESQYTVHLGTSDDEVTVEDLLVFYTDGCGIADKKLRRVVQGDCNGQNYDDTQWHDVETFCCEEAGQTIIIEVGVWDIYGNLSTCIVNVVVNSNVAPSMTCPPDITISCSYAVDFQDLTVFGTVVQDPSLVQDIHIDDPDYVEYCKNKPYTGPMYWGRDGLAYSECDLEIREDVTINTECGKSIYENGMYLPAITREFVITNESGEVNSCTQQIYIIDCNPQSTSVDWPADVVIDACLGGSTDPSETGFPTIAAGSCDDISADYVDTILVGNGDTCQHIIRHWVATSTCSDSSDVIVGEHDQNIYIIKSTPLVFENCPDTIRNELQSTRRNLVVNGDFEQGPIGFSSQYEMGALMAGRYIVTPNPGIFNNDHDCVDHTTGNGTGNLLMVDGSPNAGLWAWCQEIDVEMGQSYDVSAWVNNVVKTDRFYEDPNIDFVITTYDEVIMSSGDLPEIPDEWVELTATWIAPESITIELCARSNSSAFVGNDFALDDIAFIGMGTDCALNPDNGCEALIEVAAPTAYDCDTTIDVAWEVDLDYDGTFMADLSGTGSLPTYLPFGEHRIRWSASSMCGEQASCETVLLVEDCEPPMAICEDIGIQILQDTSGITITAEQIAGMSMDNCGDVTAQFLVCEEVVEPTLGLFGIADDTLFQIDQTTGEIIVKYGIDNPRSRQLIGLTAGPNKEHLYSIINGDVPGEDSPSLVTLSKQGEILAIQEIQLLNGLPIPQIESIGFDDSTNKLFVGANLDNDSGVRAESIVEINVANGQPSFISTVNASQGTSDLDKIGLVDNILYYWDFVASFDTYFYAIDLGSISGSSTDADPIFSLGAPTRCQGLAIKDGEMFILDNDNNLTTVSIETGESTTIGLVYDMNDFGGNRIRGLAFADAAVQPDMEVELFAIAGDTFFQIDRNTGDAFNKVGFVSPTNDVIYSLTYFEPNDAFYALKTSTPFGVNPGSIFKFSSEGQLLEEISVQDYNNVVVSNIGGLVYNPADGEMYITANLDNDGGQNTETLMTIDVETGELTFVTEIVNLNSANDVERMVIENNILYFNDYEVNSNVYFYSMDLTALTPPVTQSTFLFDLGGSVLIRGLAINEGNFYYQDDRKLIKHNIATNTIEEIGPIHSALEFGGGFASGFTFAGRNAHSQPNGDQVYGLINNTLVSVDVETAQLSNDQPITDPESELRYLIHVNNDQRFYSIENFSTTPTLVRYGEDGMIDSRVELDYNNGQRIYFVESMTYDDVHDEILVSVSLDGPISTDKLGESLLRVDRSTGICEFVFEFAPAVGQKDMDKIEAKDGVLYILDAEPSTTTYAYHINLPVTSDVQAPSVDFQMPYIGIRDAVFYEGQWICGTKDLDLISVDFNAEDFETIGQTHDVSEYDGAQLLGIAVASSVTDSCFFQNELTIDCSDLEYLQDTFPYTIVVTDQYGLTDTCAGEIIVADSMNLCNPETCEFVYGVTTSGALYSINTADGAIEFVTNVSAPGNTNALGVNASLGLAYFGSEQTVYWVDIDDGSQGVVGDIGVPGSLSAAGASYRNGYYYMGPEIANSIVDIFRVQISADGKNFAGALENLTNGVVPTGNFGDFIVVDGTPGSESMIMSINNGANNDIYDYDVASNTFTLLHQIPAFSSSQIAMDNSGTIWYFDNGDITLGMLDLNTGIVSNSNPTPITFADLGRSYCPGSAFINLPGQVTHADFTRNRPNPFTEGTTIEFTVNKPQVVTLSIISVDGRIIKQSKRHVYEGDNDWYISIDGPAGVYFYRIETADDVFTNSMLKSDRIGE